MKRCPRCNQEFTDDWLTFCTQDGTSLVQVEASSTEPPVTLVSPEMPPSVSPLEQPTLDYPDSPGRAPAPAPYSPPATRQVGWSPPPPPAYPIAPQQNLAILSLTFGVVSVTIGLCCYFGVLTAPVALGLGIYSLVMIKKEPHKYGGKGFAIGGVVTGGLYFVLVLFFIIVYGMAALMGGLN